MKILVFHYCRLRDAVIALPAFGAIRRHFPNARLTLLSDRHPGKSYVLSSDLLQGAGIFDAFESYPVYQSAAGRWLRPVRMFSLLGKLRAEKFDALVYLMRSDRTPAQVRRDRKFFGAVGIKNFIGMEGFQPLPAPTHPLPAVPHESDALLTRLAISGILVPPPGQAQMDLGLSWAEEVEVERWLQFLPRDGDRPWIGVGPGSKMPAKRWPTERFEHVVQSVIRQFDVWPVVFGGVEDQPVGEELIKNWGRGFNAAGRLGLRPSARALARCVLYLGNDTGTMHLAAAGGVPCVAVFSARDWPGRWYPYGQDHRVFRQAIDCEGCGLQRCIQRGGACLGQIQSPEVTAACAQILQQRLRIPKAA